ncbi:MAG: pilus assembly protein TadG-related protein [Armatimonadota bacterium]
MSDRCPGRRGAAYMIMVLALPVLLGVGALAVDLSILMLAAQYSQTVADQSALAAATKMPDQHSASSAVNAIVTANNRENPRWCTVADPSATAETFLEAETIPDYGQLSASATAVRVTVHTTTEFRFARIFGLTTAEAQRSAIAVRAVLDDGFTLTPMWIDRETAEAYKSGATYQVLHGSDPEASNDEVPGSFGWLDPPDGSTAGWFELLQGTDLSEEDIATTKVGIGDWMQAETGFDTGRFARALERDSSGLARMQVGSTGIYEGDSAESYHDGNPRLMICPVATYVEGSGTGAHFEVEGFAAFWLEGINQGQKEVLATFLDFYIPGDATFGSPRLDKFHTVKLVQ